LIEDRIIAAAENKLTRTGNLSMSEKKPTPPIPARVRNRCPVCGELSYSREGIHPQCLVKQADEKRSNRIKREKLMAVADKNATPTNRITPWQKQCPKCSTVQHVRKTACVCGHRFTAQGRPPTRDGERT
jgi:hypothetical protein